jgi:hypothetical protein
MDKSYLRFAALCALALAVTTFLLWLLPQLAPAAQTFEERLALASNPYYIGRLWVSIAHMFLGLAAMLGVYFLVKARSPGFALLGAAMFFMWSLVEVVSMAINLFGVNATWRAGYAAADAATQAAYRTLITGWAGAWDGLYFILGTAYLFGSLIFGALAIQGRGIERVAGVFLFAGAVLSLAFLLAGYIDGLSVVEKAAGFAYPVIQPLGRAILGVWLWRAASALKA